MWWRQREIGSRERRRNGEYEVQTGGGGAGLEAIQQEMNSLMWLEERGGQ